MTGKIFVRRNGDGIHITLKAKVSSSEIIEKDIDISKEGLDLTIGGCVMDISDFLNELKS